MVALLHFQSGGSRLALFNDSGMEMKNTSSPNTDSSMTMQWTLCEICGNLTLELNHLASSVLFSCKYPVT